MMKRHMGKEMLVYALRDNQLVFVDDVENGKKCGCVCPACSAPLIANNHGKKKSHYFSHINSDCGYGYETSLHLAAKDILSKAKKMVIPPVLLKFHSYKKDIQLSAAMEISIDSVELETRFESIIPDVVIYTGKRKLFVEIFVTHKIDEIKLAKLQEQGISTIEVDLSKKDRIMSAEELSDILLKDSEEKTWRYNATVEKWISRFYAVADRRPFVEYILATRVHDCPLTFHWQEASDADVMRTCIYCQYCIDYRDDAILCSGRLRISDIEDFKISLPERIRKHRIASGKCPNCGGDLVLCKGKYGEFWGCSRFPYCRFVASINPETGELIIKS